jgi:hypothetical protein
MSAVDFGIILICAVIIFAFCWEPGSGMAKH